MCFRRDAAPRQLPVSRGFTVVEVIVAMTLLVAGALAVVRAGVAAVRAVDSADTQLAAMAVAERRLEALASRGCSAAVSGTATDTSVGIRESWHVTIARNGLRLGADSVRYSDRGGSRLIVRARLIVC
jgi:prepilin-type N-terminal cleavage/methylation domain-containing protein